MSIMSLNRRILVGLLFFIALLMQPATSLYAQGPTLELEKEIFGGLTETESGTPFQYVLYYRCASITDNCVGATVRDPLPPEAEFLSFSQPPDIQSASYDAINHEVIFNFIDPLPAGSTGVLQINAQFPPGTLPGTVATNQAIFEAANANTVTSNPVDIEATGAFEMFPSKRIVGDVVVGFPATFEIEACSPDSRGGVRLMNPIFLDNLPPDALFIGAEGVEGVDWTYDAGLHRVTFINLPHIEVGGCLTREVTVIYNSAPAIPAQTNELEITGTPENETDPITLNADIPYTVSEPFSEGSGGKSSTSASTFTEPNVLELETSEYGTEGLPGEAITYTVSAKNSGYLTLTNVIVTDTIPLEIEVTSFTVSPASDPTMDGYYQVNTNPGIWVPLPGNPYAAQTTISVASLGLAPGEFVTALRWDLGTLPAGASNWNGNVFTFIDPAVPPGTTFQNCSGFSADSADGPLNSTACDDASAIDERAVPRVRKENSTGPYLPGQEVVFTVRMTNNDVAHLPLENPVVGDLLPVEFEYITSSYSFISGPAGAPAPNFDSIPDHNGSGRHLLRWSWDDQSGSGGTDARYTLAPGEELVVEYTIRIIDGTPPNRYFNKAALVDLDNPTGDDIFPCIDSSLYTDGFDLDGDGDTSETSCQNSDAEGFVDVDTFLSMSSEKFVFGSLDSDWNKLGLTTPGGPLEYQLLITNTSNVAVSDIVIIDILPFIGDTGVIDLSNRESEWRPNLQGPVEGPVGVPLTVYYSIESNPCRPELLPSGPAGCTDPEWSTTLPADPTSVQAIKFDFCTYDGNGDPIECYELPIDQSVELTWPMAAPSDAPTDASCLNDPFDMDDPANAACAIAWNSFGFTAGGNGLTLKPAEPIRVGIRVAEDATLSLGDFVWLDVAGQQNDGIQQPEEMGINGVRVELYDSLGQFVDYRITGPNHLGEPGYYLFTGLAADDYTVRFYPPNGYTTSPSDQGGDNGLDSDGINTVGSYIETTTISLSSDDMSWDQGLWLPTDYGDAATAYPVQASTQSSAALAGRHIIVDGIHLGSGVDAELDGQPTVDAFGDDTADGNDDEDGVTFTRYLGTAAQPTAIFIMGENNDLTINATIPSTMTGYLNAWIDWNGDGDWDDAGEQIAVDKSPSGGTINLSVSPPAGATAGATYARFRFSSQDGLTPYGTALDGEVEDYRLFLVEAPVKAIVSTSAAHTSGTDVTIGETVRYSLTVSVPEGNLGQFTITDNLPTGLQYVDGSATYTAIADTGITTGGLTVSGGPFSSGTNPVFELGNVTNNDVDTSEEQIVIAFDAVVLNIIGNQDGDKFNNNFTVTYDTFTDKSNTVRVDAVEPVLTIDKSITALGSPVEAGTAVSYQIVIAHDASSHADAFDLVVTDAIPADLTNILLGSVTVSGIAAPTASIAANLLRLPDTGTFDLPQSAVVTVTFSAQVTDTVIPGQAITNNTGVVWSTLDGDDPNERDDGVGEPDGTDLLDTPAVVDDYETTSTVMFSTEGASISKALFDTSADHTSGSNVTIGEIVTYVLTITVPAGQIPSLQVIDQLPDGMAYVNNSVNVMLGSFSGNVAPGDPTVVASPGVDGADVTLNFGAFTVPDDGDASNNSFTVQLQAVVLNVADNVGLNPPGQTELINIGTVQIGTGAVESSEPVDVTVVEPGMEIGKTFNKVEVSPGDTVSVTLVVSNTGTSTAFEVIVDDPILNAAFSAISEGSTPAGFAFSTVPSGADTIVRYTGGSIPAGEQRTFTLNLTVDPNILPGASPMNNVATVTQATTLDSTDPNDGDDSQERDEPDVDDSDQLNLLLFSLGNRVWADESSTSSEFNNGVHDASENGIQLVEVTLSISNTIVATTTTDANGYYLFDNLFKGDYVVEIGASNFITGGPLHGMYSSSTTEANPNSDGDENDNGLDDATPMSNGIRSDTIRLENTPTTEPTGESDLAPDGHGSVDDAYSNLTVDFGFFTPTSSYTISKNLVTLSPMRPHEPIQFTIQIANTGPSVITELPLTDVYSHTYFSFVSASISPTAMVAGQLSWSDLTAAGPNGFGQDLNPGESFIITVNFESDEDTTLLPNSHALNTATVENPIFDPDGAGLLPPQGMPDQSDDAVVQIINPTSVELVQQFVQYSSEGAVLNWETVNETEIVGFNLYRQAVYGEATALSETAILQINSELVLAQKAGQPNGAQYSFTDTAVETGAEYHYTMEILYADGGRKPAQLGTIQTGWELYLPTVLTSNSVSSTVNSAENRTVQSGVVQMESVQLAWHLFLPTVVR